MSALLFNLNYHDKKENHISKINKKRENNKIDTHVSNTQI